MSSRRTAPARTRCSPARPRRGGAPPTAAARSPRSVAAGCGCATTCTWAPGSWPRPPPQRGDGRLCLRTVETPHGPIATAQAGTGPPLLALHGLGGTKASFLPTLALMSGSHRVIAADLPGFGDSVKPLRAPYDAAYFAA